MGDPPPPAVPGPGRPRDMRAVLNALCCVNRTGCPWCPLPADCPHGHRVYCPYRKWCGDGPWPRIHEGRRPGARARPGRPAAPSAALRASQRVPTPAASGVRGYEAAQRVEGRKRHLLTDTEGPLRAGTGPAADIQARDGARRRRAHLGPALRQRRANFQIGSEPGQRLPSDIHLAFVLDSTVRHESRSGDRILTTVPYLVGAGYTADFDCSGPAGSGA